MQAPPDALAKDEYAAMHEAGAVSAAVTFATGQAVGESAGRYLIGDVGV
jgi:hypothetical protein